jgi:fido (protein-threonine AMPylation protein)
MNTFRDLSYMRIDIDRASLQQIAGSWEDFFNVDFRRISPILPHLDFTPPHYSDVPKLLDDLFRQVKVGYDDADFAGKAARTHNGLIYIYPFSEHSEMVARAAMQYVLMSCGKPIIDIGLSEQGYVTMTAEAVRAGDDEPMAKVIELAVKKKEIAFGEGID